MNNIVRGVNELNSNRVRVLIWVCLIWVECGFKLELVWFESVTTFKLLSHWYGLKCKIQNVTNSN